MLHQRRPKYYMFPSNTYVANIEQGPWIEKTKFGNICKIVMHRTIWYYLYNFKNVKNAHGGVLLLVKLQVEALNFTKSNNSPWVFFTF